MLPRSVVHSVAVISLLLVIDVSAGPWSGASTTSPKQAFVGPFRPLPCTKGGLGKATSLCPSNIALGSRLPFVGQNLPSFHRGGERNRLEFVGLSNLRATLTNPSSDILEESSYDDEDEASL
jgi:hypothetical protein